jgi:hypothetical protein
MTTFILIVILCFVVAGLCDPDNYYDSDRVNPDDRY